METERATEAPLICTILCCNLHLITPYSMLYCATISNTLFHHTNQVVKPSGKNSTAILILLSHDTTRVAG